MHTAVREEECASHRFLETLTLFNVSRVVRSGIYDLTEVLLAWFLMWPRPRRQQMLTVEGWNSEAGVRGQLCCCVPQITGLKAI